MSQIPEGAVARLVMINGNLVSLAEIASILETYGYEEDGINPERWNLHSDDPADADAALHVLQEGEIIDVYSTSSENMLNVNSIATRCGWADCELYSINSTIEQMMMSRTANLNVLNTFTDEPAGLPVDIDLHDGTGLPEAFPDDAFEEDHAAPDLPPALDMPLDTAEGDLEEQVRQIQHLTVQLNDAEQRAAQLEEERDDANRQIASLNAELAAMEKAPVMAHTTLPPSPLTASDPNHDHLALLSLVERYLGAMLDLSSVTESALARELQSLGYNIQVKLVRA